jgi:DNA helicase-2/ATP-dependent DNA helicase PcrA
MFLEELPPESIESADLSSSSAQRSGAVDSYRGSTSNASQGWYETGFSKTSTQKKMASVSVEERNGYEVGVLVHHEVYGVGRITVVSGQGALRKLKIRFSTGERTFLAAKAKLAIVQQG